MTMQSLKAHVKNGRLLLDEPTDLPEGEVLERIGTRPNAGTVYEQGNLEAPVRRVLMPKTKNHVYYGVEGDEIVVVSIWGAPRERGPKL